MLLETMWYNARENSTRASEGARKAAYAGIAIIWVFRDASTNQSSIPSSLVISGFLLIVALGFDLFQYIYMGEYYRQKAKNIKRELVAQGIPDIEHGDKNHTLPENSHSTSYILYWIKLTSIFLAYLVILSYLIELYLIS